MTSQKLLLKSALFFALYLISTYLSANIQAEPTIEKEANIAPMALEKIMRDQAILDEMDVIDNSIELLELDKQHPQEIFDHDYLPTDDIVRPDDDFLLDDNFDDLDLDQALFDEQSEPYEVMPQGVNPSYKSTPPPKGKIGVGIQGTDEQLINELDNSDLMDIGEEVELWLDPIEVMPQKQNGVEIIDDIE